MFVIRILSCLRKRSVCKQGNIQELYSTSHNGGLPLIKSGRDANMQKKFVMNIKIFAAIEAECLKFTISKLDVLFVFCIIVAFLLILSEL